MKNTIVRSAYINLKVINNHKMEIPIYQVDAFTHKIFAGNPAAVCPLPHWLDDDVLLNIAMENNLAETAFFIPQGGGFHLRWFTPEIEMDLCGHATLASSHVIFKHLAFAGSEIKFTSKSGTLIVTRQGDQLTMDFPSRPPLPSELPDIIQKGISISPKKVLKARDYVLVYDNEQDVHNLIADPNILKGINLDPGGIIVTAKSNEVDFVSRFFTPGASVFEDPVTGSAHCSLVPYWSEQLNKTELEARQVSQRGGHLKCRLEGDRVFISGYAQTFMAGKIFLDH